MGTTGFPPVGEGRSGVIGTVLDDFTQQTELSIGGEVREWLLTVLVPDHEWDAGLQENRFEVGEVRSLIGESLDLILRTHREFEVPGDLIEIGEARVAFYAVIHDRWRCPFPFFFC